MSPVQWQPDREPIQPPWPQPPMKTAIGRGLCARCPACGKTRLFHGYLNVVETCTACGAPLGQVRADDAPPYFTILAVGHIVIPSMFFLQKYGDPSGWTMSAIFLPLTLILTLALLRPIKGGTVGLMLRLNMLKPEPTGA